VETLDVLKRNQEEIRPSRPKSGKEKPHLREICLVVVRRVIGSICSLTLPRKEIEIAVDTAPQIF